MKKIVFVGIWKTPLSLSKKYQFLKSISMLSFILIHGNCFSQVVKGTYNFGPVKKNSDTSLLVSGTATFSLIGLAPVPFFSFDKPIAAFSLSVTKGNFSYNPGFARGLTGVPWYIDNWLKYRLINNHDKLQVSLGVNPALVFINEPLAANPATPIATRNLIIALFGNYHMSDKLSFQFTYWYNIGFDSKPLSGHFLDISCIISNISISKKLYINLKPELFYFNNFGRIDGLFTSETISVGRRKFPISLYFQGVDKLWASFPANNFIWNLGLTYVF
ncbi:MAG: hypothetical protein ACYCOO_10780 [Chitinophagaceae bacterium]